jgi:hypothetical protein
MQRLNAIAAQLLGLLAALLLLRLTHTAGLWPLVFTQAMAAALIARTLGQPSWWIPIHLLLAPAAAGLLALQLPAWVFLLAALLLGLVFWGTIKGDVPLFLSSQAATGALQRIVEAERTERFIDLGAGIGSVAVPLAQHHPDMTVEAWERAPVPWAIIQWRSRTLPNLFAIRKSFWNCDLSAYDVVYAFLSPAPMPQLAEKALREMTPGSLLVSSTFQIPGWEPETILHLEDRMHTSLYCYRIKS